MRVKSLQQVIDSQSERMAAMATDRELAALGRQDESTGQGQRGSEGGGERERGREREREGGREGGREVSLNTNSEKFSPRKFPATYYVCTSIIYVRMGL